MRSFVFARRYCNIFVLGVDGRGVATAEWKAHDMWRSCSVLQACLTATPGYAELDALGYCIRRAGATASLMREVGTTYIVGMHWLAAAFGIALT